MVGEIILYNTEDGSAALQLRARNGSVWLTQAEMAELFQTSVSNINKHIKGIIAEGEQPPATIELYSIVQTEGKRPIERQVAHYSLPMILAVGFRVRSPRGAQFRRWAAATLSDYLVKGFVMDDARLKDPEAETSNLFFQTVQNKLHWAAHGHTAAEIVVERADASKDYMGLTAWAAQPSAVERHFTEALSRAKALEKGVKRT